MRLITRSGWGARPAKSVTPWNPAALRGIVVHWWGKPAAADTHPGCTTLCQAVQRSHQAGEFSDIAYNFGVCPHGYVFEMRGWDVQTGANGTSDTNRNYLAIVYMAGEGDPLTAQAKDAMRELIREAFRRGVGREVRTHGSITGSECPGPAVKVWMATTPWEAPVPKPKVRFELWDNGQLVEQSLAVEVGPSEGERLRFFLDAHRGLILKRLQTDGNVQLRRVAVVPAP